MQVRHGADIAAKDINNETPLMLAAHGGFLDVVQYFLTIGKVITTFFKGGRMGNVSKLYNQMFSLFWNASYPRCHPTACTEVSNDIKLTSKQAD